MERKCVNCGSDFVAAKHDVARGFGKFCCRGCYGEWQSKNSTMENNHAWKGKTKSVVCGECGESFYKDECQIKRGGGKFCSRKCLGKWWSKNKVGKNAPGWKGGKVPQQFLVRNSERYKLWRRMVFIRDHFTCRHCGKSVSGHMEAHHIKMFCELVKEAGLAFPELPLYDACMSYAPLWDLENGLTLCDKCHGKIPKRKQK